MAETPQAQKKLREVRFFLNCLKAEETKPTDDDKPVNSIGDVVPEAVNVGSAPPATTTVSATA